MNNTEINTGLRLAPKISDKIVDQLYASANIMALERGWHGFTTNNVSVTLEEMKKADVKLSPGPVARYTLTFASGRVYEIVPQGRHTAPTMAERGLKTREEYSWRYDIRDRVDAALLVSTSVDDFIGCVDRYGIDVSQNKAGQFKFSMRGGENKSKTVSGKTLGKRYDRPSIVSKLEEDAAV